MKDKLLALLTKLGAKRFAIHTSDSGAVTGLTAYDVKSFETEPIVALLDKSDLGWIVIENKQSSLSNKGNMLPPRMYVGQASGGTIDDVAQALDTVQF